FNFRFVKKLEEGTPLMQKIAAAIRLGASTFMKYELRILIIVVSAVAVLVFFALEWYVSLALLLGAFLSAMAGQVGMTIATYANVRVTNEARTTNNLGKTLKVAFRGGSVMGLCVGGFALGGLCLLYFLFGIQLGWLQETTPHLSWLTHIELVRFPNVLSGYSLGCSLVAIFNRVGVGIYTKAADMGADLVGKTEAHIPEDDPRNPATIADNVGDNVGDTAGLGSDLLESYVASITSTIILAYNLVLAGTGISGELLEKLYTFPLALAATGLLACCVGIFWLLVRDLSKSEDPHSELNGATWISAGITILAAFLLSKNLFGSVSLKGSGFRLGFYSPWLSISVGVIAGVVIGMISEYYTSADYKPTKILAEASKDGPALTVTSGLALGMKSCMAPAVVLTSGIIISYYTSGLYGVALSALGMLSFVTATVAVDTYGPISDNAGGIAEMSELDHHVREITDTLDSVGNTTAAIGKGFAIGSGALAALSLMISYMYSYNTVIGNDFIPVLNIIAPLTLSGAIVGAALPFLFSGILIDAVARVAEKMVEEVRHQFRDLPGILIGTQDPDYESCIGISTKGAIAEMKFPAVLSVVVPVFCGFLFGPEFVGGVLIGSTVSSIMIAIFTGNAGGAWDNGKKYIEKGGVEGATKGSSAHDASVVGDTVGDPLKDTVGPCMDIFIKIMSTVSLVAVSVFSHYNLWSWIVENFLK
ncbi:MAG: sodium-translocating pyrophosphatase, partial [Erysipelotrichaceae bacterium]|nr:sodium-translocating pyrophosphatase [Erysipelotrichaceae bacterium]